MEIIISLVHYLNQCGDNNSFQILDFDEPNIRIVATKIAKWLKTEYKRYLWVTEGKKNLHKSLELNYNYQWCCDLRKMVIEDSRLSKIFEITEIGFDFRSDLNEEEKNIILMYVGKNLKRQIII